MISGLLLGLLLLFFCSCDYKYIGNENMEDRIWTDTGI